MGYGSGDGFLFVLKSNWYLVLFWNFLLGLGSWVCVNIWLFLVLMVGDINFRFVFMLRFFLRMMGNCWFGWSLCVNFVGIMNLMCSGFSCLIFIIRGLDVVMNFFFFLVMKVMILLIGDFIFCFLIWVLIFVILRVLIFNFLWIDFSWVVVIVNFIVVCLSLCLFVCFCLRRFLSWVYWFFWSFSLVSVEFSFFWVFVVVCVIVRVVWSFFIVSFVNNLLWMICCFLVMGMDVSILMFWVEILMLW